MIDNYIHVPYTETNFNMADLSQILKSNYLGVGVDGAMLSSLAHTGVNENPPIEIYEYQPITILEKNGLYFLLDGFRRLLVYRAPSIEAKVRVYRFEDMSTEQIFKILLALNHQKFHGMGEFHKRGFSLLCKVLFDFNLNNFEECYLGYVGKAAVTRSYGNSNSISGYGFVVQRLLNPNFVSHMKFIEFCVSKGLMMDDVFGTVLYKRGGVYDAQIFCEKVLDNPLIIELIEKYNKCKDSRYMEIGNKIQDLYINIMDEMDDKNVEPTIEEIAVQQKNEETKLKKDGYVKISHTQNVHGHLLTIKDAKGKGKTVDVKIVVFPVKQNPYLLSSSNPPHKHGVFDIKDINFGVDERLWHKPMTANLDFGFAIMNYHSSHYSIPESKLDIIGYNHCSVWYKIIKNQK